MRKFSYRCRQEGMRARKHGELQCTKHTPGRLAHYSTTTHTFLSQRAERNRQLVALTKLQPFLRTPDS